MPGRSSLTDKQRRVIRSRAVAAKRAQARSATAPARLVAQPVEGPGDTIQRLRANGVALDMERIGPKATEVRHRRKPGLDWLKDKGRITKDQYDAGTRYGASFRALEDAGTLKSHLNFTIGGGEAVIGTDADWRASHRMWLTRARAFVHSHVGMIRALDAVCGRELTPREIDQNRDVAERIEHELRLALDLLVIMEGKRAAA